MSRFGFGFYAVLAALGAIAACAGEGSDPSGGPEAPDGPDASSLPEGEGGRSPLEAGSDGDASPDVLCSTDGWCAPTVPEPPPAFLDLWPLADTAFAVSSTGILQLEDDRWVYVNDRHSFGRAIWASSRDDVWVAGVFGTVVHGVRQNGAWTWTSEKIAGDTTLTAIWGSGAGDVYVIVADTFVRGGDVYHRVSDGAGGARWQSELRDDVIPDVADSNRRLLTSISGAGPDDIWISGRRSGLCGYLAHKSRGSFTVVADCDSQCTPAQGCLVVEKAPLYFDRLYDYTPVQAEPLGPKTAIFLRRSELVRFEHVEGTSFGVSRVPVTGVPPGDQPWIWAPNATHLYVAGRSQVRHAPEVTADGGAFAISSIALNGAPLRADFKVRGTSASNVWAFGGRYAVHKTTP